MPLNRFANKSWVLWHDNLGTAMQKVGWIVAGFAPGQEIELTQQELRSFDLKFLAPRWNDKDEKDSVYLCALPNPNGQPYLIRPQTNRMVAMPSTKSHNYGIETLNDQAIGQQLLVRSDGSSHGTVVSIGDTAIGRLQSIDVHIDEKGAPRITLVGYLPDLSIVGKVITLDTFDPLAPST